MPKNTIPLSYRFLHDKGLDINDFYDVVIFPLPRGRPAVSVRTAAEAIQLYYSCLFRHEFSGESPLEIRKTLA